MSLQFDKSYLIDKAIMFGFNRWASPGMNYMGMNGWNAVDYSGGWNPAVHDMMLQQNINRVFMQYDMNMSGQL